MKTSVVGLFDNVAQAQAVSRDLVAQGIAQDAIQLLASEGKGGDSASGDRDSGKGFFARLGEMLGIGKDDDAGAQYDEGVRRGGVLVVVSTEGALADQVVAVLQRHGAADFQQHWTTSLASAGGSFEEYTPAYRHGIGLAADPRYRGVDWAATRVHFDTDSAQIRAVDHAALNRTARCLKGSTSTRLTIEGGADERGPEQHNAELAEKRAMAVARYLQERGVSGDQLKVVSYGDNKPLCLESDKECWARNRQAALKPQ